MKSGARVQVTLKFVNKNRNYHVALVDKLPSGLEGLNAAIAGTTGVLDVTETRRYSLWYEHVRNNTKLIEIDGQNSKILEMRE
jgi:uncharacterized protein YfaS (alpha-2-macroglobulin family)